MAILLQILPKIAYLDRWEVSQKHKSYDI